MTSLLEALPPVVAPVECSGQRHRIRWAGGDLTALDHDDPEGERTLAALGGPSCVCLEVLDAWSRQRQSARVLTALSRGARDPVRPQELWGGPGPSVQRAAMLRAARARSTAPTPPAPVNLVLAARGPQHAGPQAWGQDPVLTDLGALSQLGFPMTLRLVSTVTAVLLEQADEATRAASKPALTASLFGRSWTALRDWLGVPDLEMDLVLPHEGSEPSIELRPSGPLRVALPLDWVVSVWARDLTVVAGRFCLEIVEATESRTTLLSVGPDFEAPRRLVVELH